MQSHPIDEESLDESHHFEGHLEADGNDGMEDDKSGNAHKASVLP